MPQLEEVAGQLAAGPQVVEDDVVPPARPEPPVVHQTRIAGGHERLDHRVVQKDGPEDDPVHPPLSQDFDVLLLQPGLVVGIA